MGAVIPILGPRTAAPVTPYDDFAMARRAMLRAYVVWLRTQPEHACISEEIISTHSTMDQLRQLEPSHG